jgi:2-C-methyl-D-erythritol 4-phosphate cytidylyltransferase/2-C-methyl-D-erythritol 2,4-cyclodiphosphate synthase
MSGCIALIVGAGRSHRFRGEIPKQYKRLVGRPIINRTVSAFISHPSITGVRAVIHPDDISLYEEAIEQVSSSKLLVPVKGGDTRQQSVSLGLESLIDYAPNFVLIHDAARPFVSIQIIDRVIEALGRSKGAIAAIPVNDTLKKSDGDFVATTVDRESLWQAQTPQGFHFGDIFEAHKSCEFSELTDDAAVAEKAKIAVELVMGSHDNVKITTMDDFIRAECSLGGWEYRTGTGFDVHRFCKGNEIILCGVKLPSTCSLEGHSDADVALHALSDALFGAVAAGDIGDYFPPSDPQWKDVSSDIFLDKARDIIRKQGAYIVNVDITIICEEPKIGPHRQAMRSSVATILKITEDRVSIKATTTEQLGFTGRKEGIAVNAVATVKRP